MEKIDIKFNKDSSEWQFSCFGFECAAHHAPLPHVEPSMFFGTLLPDTNIGIKYNGYLTVSDQFTKEKVEWAFGKYGQEVTFSHENKDGTITYGFDTLHIYNTIQDGLLENVVAKCYDIAYCLKDL